MSKIKVSLLIGFFTSMIPGWIGSAMLPNLPASISINESNLGIAILILFALCFWGTSWAYIYLKRIKYALLSGLGKWGLIFLGILLHQNLQGHDENVHPYLIFLGILVAAIWGIIDFCMLYYVAKKVNLDK